MLTPELDEDEARRVAAFFVDLMATLTTEEVGEEEVTALLRSIWSNRPPDESGGHDREEDLIAGFVRVAVAMAHMVVQERRVGGQLDACVSDVWSDLRDFLGAMEGDEPSVIVRQGPGRPNPGCAGAAGDVELG